MKQNPLIPFRYEGGLFYLQIEVEKIEEFNYFIEGKK